jgi:DNA-binding HxlR family transcriptional regulator
MKNSLSDSKLGCINSALTILGDKWSPLLIKELTSGAKTFGDLEESLSGISPRTLSHRLEKLIHYQIVEKHCYCDHPPRYAYGLSIKGSELEGILRSMADWGARHHATTSN